MHPLEDLEEVAGALHADGALSTLAGIRRWVSNPAAHVVVCGEFKRGKSTLVNALIGHDVCPTDALPATAVPAILHWSPNPQATVHYTDGRSVELAATSSALGALSVGGDLPVDGVRFVDVGVPSALLSPGLVLIDTPGVNDLSRQRADVTYRFLPMADAVLVVLDATAPVTRTETAFLTEQVLPGTRDRLLFALGKVDRLEDDELAEALEGASVRLRQLMGREVALVPVSARRATQGDLHALDGLRRELARVLDGCTSDRETRLRARLAQVAKDMHDEAQLRLSSLEASPGERADARVRVEQLALDLEQRFARLREYVAQYGEQTLKELVAASLTKVHRDLEEDLLHTLASLPTGIPAYIQQQVPYRVALRLRQWAEAKGPEIEAFLNRFIVRVAQDFAQEFAAPLELAGLTRGIATPALSAATHQAVTNRTEEVLVGRLLPTALPIAAGMLMFGPLGGVAGSMIGQLAATHFESTKVETQRAEGRPVIERELKTAVDAFRASLDDEIGRWFTQLQSLLRTSLEGGRARSVRLLTDPHAGESAALQTQLGRLQMIRTHLSDGGTA